MKREQDSGLTAERLRERLHYNPETGIFTWHQNKWRARISIDQRHVHLGCFGTAEEAHASYAAAAHQYHGEFARVG